MTRTELVTDLRDTGLPSDHLEEALLFEVGRENHSIDTGRIRALEALLLRLVAECVQVDALGARVDLRRGQIWSILVNEDVSIVECLADARQSILV